MKLPFLLSIKDLINASFKYFLLFISFAEDKVTSSLFPTCMDELWKGKRDSGFFPSVTSLSFLPLFLFFIFFFNS